MPADDIGHPIPDLTGYITEGQIVLSRDARPARHLPADERAAQPVAADEGRHRRQYTHPDHPALASQLFAAYARAAQARVLASVVGAEGLADTDRRYLRLGSASRRQLVQQSGPRTLEESMAIGWGCCAGLPRSELTRLSDAQIAAHLDTLAPEVAAGA
jgi:V/A-type H+-transporting ATPase subunit B